MSSAAAAGTRRLGRRCQVPHGLSREIVFIITIIITLIQIFSYFYLLRKLATVISAALRRRMSLQTGS